MDVFICERCHSTGLPQSKKPMSLIGFGVGAFGFIALKNDWFGALFGSTPPGNMAAQAVMLAGLGFGIVVFITSKPSCYKCGSSNIIPIDSPKGKTLVESMKKEQ